MSSNSTPTNRVILLSLAHSMHAGQVTYGATVGLLHHLAPGMDTAIKKIEGDATAAAGSAANKGSQLVYREAINASNDATGALMELSDGEVKAWLDGYRSVLAGLYGKQSSAAWVAAGFPTDSTSVPRSHEARQTLLGSARAFLAANPTYETSLPQLSGTPMAITAVAALTSHDAMQTARTLIDTRASTQVSTKTARDADVQGLYDEVSSTNNELGDLLEDTDPRWESFGLNIPASPNAPEGVASLTVTAAGAGRELASWEYAPRSDYYRVFLKRVGTDTEAANVADPRDLEFTLKQLTTGSTIEVYVVPMNDGGPGPASPTVSKIVGA